MAYTPKNWVTDELMIEGDLDHIEQGIVDAHAGLPPTPAGQSGKWLTSNGTAMVWQALPAGAAVDYENAWSAGVAYQAGDVVTHNGVDYLAVNPSTGSTPPAAIEPTLALSPALFNAKGDILVATANDTPSIVPVGTNGQALVADSAYPAGVKWAASVPTPIGANGTVLMADSTAPSGAKWALPFTQLTAAQYAALGAGVSANTLYIIVG